MFSTTLPLLPPSSASLLPPLHTPMNDVAPPHGAHLHLGAAQQRRNKHLHQHPRSSIHILTLDERTIVQRKLAIAMYGYSWLKPAGCTKTMLGRREEELEREEVERQLREVEMQERIAAEGEAEAEAERRADMRRLELEAEVNGGVIEGQPVERDLDDDIPEAEDEEEDNEEEDDDEEEGEEEEDMDGDLDDDIPDADAGESSWVYDTNRDSDTESENDQRDPRLSSNMHPSRTNGGSFVGLENAAETEAMVNAMLDEDELGELDRNIDMHMDVDMDEGERDLDDDVPEAESEGEWQHTDTELEESDMDISVLPTSNEQYQPSSSGQRQRNDHNIGPGTTHEEMRRTSGNILMPPPQLPPPSSGRQQVRQGQITRNITPQTRAQYHTPGMNTADSISNMISTDGSNLSTGTDMRSNIMPVMAQEGIDPQRNRRNWLNASGARRNLFSAFNRNTTDAGGSGFTPEPRSHQEQQQQQTQNRPTNTSSGGLFTPSPRITSGGSVSFDGVVQDVDPEPPRSRTRSGRIPNTDRNSVR